MNTWKLIKRSLSFYRKTNLWVILGTMMSTAILVGALIIGDSVRYSLQQIVFKRLGKTEFALVSGDRFFRSQLADELAISLNTTVAPLLQTKGIAIVEGGQRRLNNLQIIGVDDRFGESGNSENLYNNILPDEAIVNRYLASYLDIKKNDEILLRIEKLDFMPKDAPLALDSESSIARRFKVKAITEDDEFGRFNLKADQVAPYTVFVSLATLSQVMGFDDRANVLLVSEKIDNPLNINSVDDALKKNWTLADAGFELKKLKTRNIVELRSNRIFIDPPIETAALQADKKAQPILTYFVNELKLGNKATPYSFVSAPAPSTMSLQMNDDEIVISDWLANDLNAQVGDRIELTYFIPGSMRELIEKSAVFTIKTIYPLQKYADQDLLPDFPGLADAENCRDWKPGISIDLSKIRKKDEDYWDKYRGTPKAFITLNAAQKMWQNRFGNLTAIRFSDSDKNEIEQKLEGAIDPVSLGFVFRNVKAEGLRASTQSVDFSGLFLGLSFFIIVAALLLTGLLFVFNVEKRSEENGLYLALGFDRKLVKRFMLYEGAILVVVGSILGSIIGIVYNLILIEALKTVWYGAVGTSALQIHVQFSTIIIGTFIGIVIALFTIWLVARRQVKQPISDLQKGIVKLQVIGKKKPWISVVIGIACIFLVIFILIISNFGKAKDAFTFFFIAGFLILTSGIAFSNMLLHRSARKANHVKLNLINLGIRNNVRRRTRSLTLIGLLASGLFIVFTVGANRQNAVKDAERRDSGTGGFALMGESVIPILYDLNSQKGQEFYNLDQAKNDDVTFVQFRVKEGDDASCLNLNRVANPQLLGVDPDELSKRESFSFVATTDDVDQNNPWAVLEENFPDDAIPGIADQTVIVWGLGKAVGDTLIYLDERGEPLKIKLVGGLANSIFQGNIIISEKNFIKKYPSISGYRFFLIDSPFKNLNKIQKDVTWAMQDQGLDLIPASERLEQFNTVQNTYLSIFLILGSFGLILGSIGIGIVVWRNIIERRGEIALLQAVGFNRKLIQKMILSEHVALIIGGILLGIIAALIATLPSMIIPGSEIPFFTIMVSLIAVLINGFLWTYFATVMATKGDLLSALRRE